MSKGILEADLLHRLPVANYELRGAHGTTPAKAVEEGLLQNAGFQRSVVLEKGSSCVVSVPGLNKGSPEPARAVKGEDDLRVASKLAEAARLQCFHGSCSTYKLLLIVRG